VPLKDSTKALSVGFPGRETSIRATWHARRSLTRYGLWLFSLRTGHYSEALRFAMEMMTQATEAKDDDALATAQRLAGVSRHSLGDHAEGRAVIEFHLPDSLCNGKWRFWKLLKT
jgi:hypothetical protein